MAVQKITINVVIYIFITYFGPDCSKVVIVVDLVMIVSNEKIPLNL